jgi:hypothetical protein
MIAMTRCMVMLLALLGAGAAYAGNGIVRR